MSAEETFRRVLTARLPAGPCWTAWIDGTVAELAGCAASPVGVTESEWQAARADTAEARLEQVRDALDTQEARADTPGERWVVKQIRAALEAPPVGVS